ncbi:MAG: hypothetical protein Q9177_001487 [Variospora cf. flavescens]
MANKVVSSSGIKSITNSGRLIALKYATETDSWKRLTLSANVKDGFAEAMEKADVPTNATAAILTEAEHPSQKDSYPHYTTTFVDKDGKHITTKHVYP